MNIDHDIENLAFTRVRNHFFERMHNLFYHVIHGGLVTDIRVSDADDEDQDRMINDLERVVSTFHALALNRTALFYGADDLLAEQTVFGKSQPSIAIAEQYLSLSPFWTPRLTFIEKIVELLPQHLTKFNARYLDAEINRRLRTNSLNVRFVDGTFRF